MPRVVAVDLPRGLHPDTGAADDAVLPASVTVTFGAVKAGLVTGRGPDLAGAIVLVDIGLSDALASVEPVGEASVSRVVTAQR
jgi:NAD(P)H-hydrate epimerase